MPYQVEQLIESQGVLVCVQKDDAVSKALALMIEHDFSQLPVTYNEPNWGDIAEGMITYEGIIRGIRNFRMNIEDLKVRDVMSSAPTFSIEGDLFDILDELKETNAVLITGPDGPELVGIVTSYDASEYFRNRTEDLMRVEEVELTIKDLIKRAYTSWNERFEDELDAHKLDRAVKTITNRGANSRPKTFEELTMAEYVNLLTLPDTWDFFKPVFNLPVDSVRGLLNSVRETRNSLAHFRGDLTSDQRDRLKFAVDWLTRCQAEYEKKRHEEWIQRIRDHIQIQDTTVGETDNPAEVEPLNVSVTDTIPSTDFAVIDVTKRASRYAALADWLQSQPGRIDQVTLTFNQIEEVIGSNLPDSARVFRAWWANDTVGHSHSQLWLDAGWRTTYINLNEGRVTFSRIKEREKAYIEFFSKLLDELRKIASFPIRDVSPDGASWIVLQPIPRSGPSYGSFSFSFSRDKRLRVELYLDLLDKEKTKYVFDQLYACKDEYESQVGPIEWERLDNRRASRLALYKEGQITDGAKHGELRQWAVENMIKFYNTMIEPTEKAIGEALNSR